MRKVDKWESRRTFFALAAQYLINALVYSTYIARLPDLRQATGLSLGSLGTIITIGNVAGLIALPIGSRLLLLTGSRILMVSASVVYVASLPVLTLTRQPSTLLAAVAVMMVSNTLVDVALARQSALFSARQTRPVMSRLAGIYSVGALGGAALAAAISHTEVGITTHLVILSAVLGITILIGAPSLLGRREDDADRVEPEAKNRSNHVMMFITLMAVSAATVPLDVGPGEWATFRAREDLHLSGIAVTAAYCAFTLGMCSGRFLGDHITGILGRIQTFQMSIACSAVGIFTACLIPSTALMYIGFAMAGLGTAVQAPLLTEVAGQGPHTALSAFFIGNRLAGLATPVTIGFLAGLTSTSVGVAIAIVALPCACALAIFGKRVFVDQNPTSQY